MASPRLSSSRRSPSPSPGRIVAPLSLSTLWILAVTEADAAEKTRGGRKGSHGRRKENDAPPPPMPGIRWQSGCAQVLGRTAGGTTHARCWRRHAMHGCTTRPRPRHARSSTTSWCPQHLLFACRLYVLAPPSGRCTYRFRDRKRNPFVFFLCVFSVVSQCSHRVGEIVPLP
jgi:hypothetical protein